MREEISWRTLMITYRRPRSDVVSFFNYLQNHFSLRSQLQKLQSSKTLVLEAAKTRATWEGMV